jgi:hypothetical protein
MKEQVLKRDMFTKPMSKTSKNSGIMAGFEDMEPEEDEMPPMARSPQNPEILMNNLRGDFRSVDARYAELAQMVGEEAASETPPEVLAMLQPQLAAPAAPPQPPQGGIGALPQGAGMAPPPEMMGSMAPPPMPQGMEGMPPFPQGGADNAPPTPDGLPPLRAAAGSFVANILRGGYDLGKAGIGKVADEASMIGSSAMNAARPYLTQADEFFGSMLPPSLRTSVMRGEDGRPIVVQGRESIVSGPGREPMGLGEGTRLTQGRTIEMSQPPLSQVLGEQMSRNPGATKATMIGGGTALGLAGGNSIYDTITKQRAMTPAPNQAEIDARVNQIPLPDRAPPAPPADVNALATSEASNNFTPIPANSPIFRQETTTEPKKDQTTTSFIADQLKREAAATPEKDFGTRVKEGYAKLEPTFREILGNNKDDIRTNALLLLADAGFKLASTKRANFAMALSESLSGMPKGFAALIAQSKERDMKIKTAAMQQAVDNVNLQDKYAMQHQLEQLKARAKKEVTMLQGDFKILEKQIENGIVIREDNGMGQYVLKNKNGNVIGYQTDMPEVDPKTGQPKSNTVASDALQSRYTLRDTDNPYVENRGPAPTTQERDKGERVKLGNTLRSLDNSLATLDNLKGTYAQVYGPGAWFTDKVNNLFVPVSAGTIRPDVNLTDASTRISTGMNSILKNIASANDGGRVAVQEQEWARDTAKGINDPTAFFSNKEIAAKQFAAMEAMLRNSRQQVLTQLGFEGNDYVMATPNTGTQSDPFVYPSDPEGQRRMSTFLGSTIGTIQDPRATVYIKMPDGTVVSRNPATLKRLLGQ